MKSPLRYQVTDADCGKTSFVNAFMYLFEREEIPPQVIDFITRATGDCNLGVLDYYRGTSANAIRFMAAWCNDYLAKAGIPVHCQFLSGDEVSLRDGSPLAEGLSSGAVAVCGCNIGVDHYVLMTGIEGNCARVFDPFYEPYPPLNFELPESGVRWVDDAPFSHNRLVDRALMDDPAAKAYTLFAKSGRDAVLIWRTSVKAVHWYKPSQD